MEIKGIFPKFGMEGGMVSIECAGFDLNDTTKDFPQIHFGPPSNRVFALLQEWARLVGRDGGGWSDFRTLLAPFIGLLLFASYHPRRLTER